MRAEKFIERKTYNNIMIRVFEIKPIKNFDIDLLLDTIQEVIGDDFETLAETGLSIDYSEDWYSIDIDKIIDKFTEYLSDNGDDEAYVVDRINKCMIFLSEYKGFTIYNTKEDKKWK